MRQNPHATARAAVRAVAPAAATRVAALWRRLIKELFDPYRPERHYMRGPGPKWRARHGIPG